MKSLARIFLCAVVAAICGYLGFLLVAIFWPLLFPLSLRGSSLGEDAVAIVISVFFMLFGAGGFVLCWKLTRSFVRKEDGTAEHSLLR
jgi:hypothetical protein